MLGLGLNLYKYRKLGGGFDPMAQAWFDEYEVQTGTPFPNTYKVIYNQLFLDLQGLGSMGANNCFDAYKVIKGSPGYYDGVNKWPLLSDFVTPTNTPMTEINGGGSYVNVGTDPNVYTRQAAALKAWNTQEVPSSHAYLTTSSAAYGTWFLTDITADNSLYLLGCSNGAFTSQLGIQPRTSNQTIAVVNGTAYFGALTSGAHGYYEIHRTAASGAGCTQMLKDNSVIATGNNTSTAVPDTDIICCGFSYDNGSSISQTVTGGETPNDGIITIIDRSAWTSSIGQQFYDSFVQFYTDLGITL